MSIIVDFRYDYWGDNGRYHESKLEEFDTEQAAILDLGLTAHHNAIDNTLKINRVLGGEADAVERIAAGVQGYVAAEKLRGRITVLRGYVADNEKWFANLEAESARRQSNLAEHKAELLKLEALSKGEA